VLDDLSVHSTHGGGVPDGAPPPSVESVTDGRALSLAFDSPLLNPRDFVRCLVIADALRSHGHEKEAATLMARAFPQGAAEMPRLRGAVAEAVYDRAVRAYAAGGSEEDLIAALTTSASLGSEGSGRGWYLAREALAAARSNDTYVKTDGSPLDALVRKRIADLHHATCEMLVDDQWPGNDPIGRVRALGFTAIDELYDAQRDVHLTRCLNEGEFAPSLATVGSLARTTIARIVHGGETFDRSDVECGHEGYDKEAIALVDDALSKHDVPQAIAITKSALGWLRVSMVEKLGNVGGADVVAFLQREAVDGPVVLARVEAARTLTASTRAWVAPMIDALKDALAREDSPHARCDGTKVVSDGLRELLRANAKDTLNALQTRQTTQGAFGPRGLIRLAPILAMFTPTSAADAKARDALLVSMLDDIRAAKGTSMTYQGSTCTDPTPSDLAALTLGKRLGVGYSCELDLDQRRARVEQIRSKMVH
jgi:hypothetical protein